MKIKQRTLILTLIFLLITLITTSIYLGAQLSWKLAYDKDKFNCVDMSYKLAPYFHKIGLDTKIIYGSNNDTGHCWLSLNGYYFDATSLWFNDEKKYPNIDFIDSYPYGYEDEQQ